MGVRLRPGATSARGAEDRVAVGAGCSGSCAVPSCARSERERASAGRRGLQASACAVAIRHCRQSGLQDTETNNRFYEGAQASYVEHSQEIIAGPQARLQQPQHTPAAAQGRQACAGAPQAELRMSCVARTPATPTPPHPAPLQPEILCNVSVLYKLIYTVHIKLKISKWTNGITYLLLCTRLSQFNGLPTSNKCRALFIFCTYTYTET